MPKAKISISMDVNLILWVDEQVKKGTFKSRSQGIEHCIKQQMREKK